MWTLESLKKNYEYKATIKALMYEYPWIKGVKELFKDEYKSLLFITLFYDLSELAKEYNFEVVRYVKHYLKNDEQYCSVYLNSVLKNKGEASNSFLELERSVNKFLLSAHESKTIPEPMKLNKHLYVSNWCVVPISKSKYPKLIAYTQRDEDDLWDEIRARHTK